MNYFYSFFKKNVHIEKEKIYEEEPLISLHNTIISIDDYYNTNKTNVSLEDTNNVSNVSIYDKNNVSNVSIYDKNNVSNVSIYDKNNVNVSIYDKNNVNVSIYNKNNVNIYDTDYTSNVSMEDSKKEELTNKKYCICTLLKKIYRYMKCC